MGDTELFPVSQFTGNTNVKADCIGLVFPVHIWGLPGKVITFVNYLPRDSSTYYFALAVSGGQVAATLLQLKKLISIRGLILSSGFHVVMPSNYIPWGGPGPQDIQQKRFLHTRKKIEQIATIVRNREKKPVEKGPLWQNLLFTLIYRMSYPHIYKIDKKFWVDNKCNSCRVCEKVCVAKNIEIKDGKPAWLHSCEQCLACIQWCPQKAIQFGKKTPEYERYHHPEITIEDFIAGVPE